MADERSVTQSNARSGLPDAPDPRRMASERHSGQSRREISGERQAEDGRVDYALRPKSLDEMIGQERMREKMRILVQAARQRGEPLDHVLLYGPPGLGKTTLSHILAHEMQGNLKPTSGPAIEKAGDLAAILTNLRKGTFCSLTRSTVWAAWSRRFSTRRWRILCSTSRSAAAPAHAASV